MALNDKKELIEEIKEHLDQSIDAIDSKTLSRIRDARIEAIGQKRAKWISFAIPLSGVAVSAVAILLIINLMTGPDDNQTIQSAQITESKVDMSEPGVSSKENIAESIVPQVALGENEISPEELSLIELLSEEQEFDLIENLEFYTWLAENENSAR